MNTKILLSFLFCLISTGSLLSQYYPDYEESSWLDPSFEAKAESHQQEFINLNYYFQNLISQPKDLFGDYQSLLLPLYADVIAEKAYLDLMGVSCENVRLCPDELALLPQRELDDYYTVLSYITANYAFTNAELQAIYSEIDNLESLVNIDLDYGRLMLLEYLELAKELGYTKLEMLRDFTGYCSPLSYVADIMGDKNNYPLKFTRANQGLGALQAIQRLEDLLKCTSTGGEGLKLGNSEGSLDVFTGYPNPTSQGFNFVYTLPQERIGYKIIIYDASGSKIQSLPIVDNLKGEHMLSWDGNDASGNRVRKGIYFGALTNNTGSSVVSSIKIIIN